MFNIDALHLQVLEHLQMFNILKCDIAPDIRTEGCRMDIQISVSGRRDLEIWLKATTTTFKMLNT